MNAAHLHLITNHLPVIGGLATLLLLLGGLLCKQRPLITAALTGMVLIAISAVVTAIYGEQAQEFVASAATKEFTDFHVQVGIIARNVAIGVGSCALALLAGFRTKPHPGWLVWAAIGMNLLLLGIMAWAANSGGKISHPEAYGHLVQPKISSSQTPRPYDAVNEDQATPTKETPQMDTYQEQLAFFQDHWPAIQTAGEQRGAAAILAYIRAFEVEQQRRVLFVFARQGLTNPDWEAGNLDLLIEVADAGIAELLSQAATATDAEIRKQRTDTANVISFNLAADLADCWPGDDTQRETMHFERGLKAADECIKWREELDKGPGPLSMAWWAKGMHELSLGRGAAAEQSFGKSFEFARSGALADGGSIEVSADAGFAVLLGAGYLGLAQWGNGNPAGETLYEQAVAAFRDQLEDDAKREDAEFGISQLEKVFQVHAPQL